MGGGVFGQADPRRYMETSRLTSFFPKKIQAVTPRGFELKIVWFLLAFSVQCLQRATRVMLYMLSLSL